jgi:putative transposase
MNHFNPNIHHRRSIRLKGYDYAQAGLYFITICCQDRAFLFGEVVDGKMILNAFGEIAYQEWQATEQIRENTVLHEFIVMPNHIHGIIEITFKKNDSESEIGKFQSPSQTIGAIIRGYKIATIKKIKDRILNSRNSGELEIALISTGDYDTAKSSYTKIPKATLK